MSAVDSAWHNPNRILMGPGPSNIHPRVLLALAQQTIGHLDPALLTLMDRMQEQLRRLFGTRNGATLAVSGTGMAGMEACLASLLEPGDRVVVGICGYFGGRQADIARRCGAEVTVVEGDWGRPLDPAAIVDAIRRAQPNLVSCVHAETSTGVLQPVAEIGAAARQAGALFLLDTVTSLGGLPVRLDEWNVDAAYSGTQKCVGCPSGLSPVSFSDRGMERIRGRRSPVQSFYLDVSLLSQYWGPERIYHHTAPANMFFGLAEALALIDEEGLEARHARHRRNAEALWVGVEAMGLSLFAPADCRLPSLTTIRVPDGVDEAAARKSMLASYNLEIGGGLGPLKGQVWRVGLMGHSSSPSNVLLFLTALEQAIRAQGATVGSGTAAAAAVLGG